MVEKVLFLFWPISKFMTCRNMSFKVPTLLPKSIPSTARGDDANPHDNAPERSDSEHGDGAEPLADDQDEDDSSKQSDHAEQGDDDDTADGDADRDAGQGVLGRNLFVFYIVFQV